MAISQGDKNVCKGSRVYEARKRNIKKIDKYFIRIRMNIRGWVILIRIKSMSREIKNYLRR